MPKPTAMQCAAIIAALLLYSAAMALGGMMWFVGLFRG